MAIWWKAWAAGVVAPLAIGVLVMARLVSRKVTAAMARAVGVQVGRAAVVTAAGSGYTRARSS